MARDLIDTDDLVTAGWRTPSTYDNRDYGCPQPLPGIYLFAVFPPPLYHPEAHALIAYVGKSLKISRRIAQHSVLRAILAEAPEAYVQPWFQHLPAEHIGEVEVEAIKKYNPPFNIQHRRRGLSV